MLGVESSEIVEGFICPICKSDEKKLEKLLQHFEEKHSEEKDLVQSFRNVFKIAKNKILNIDDTELSRAFDNTLKSGFSLNSRLEDFDFKELQEIGSWTEHIDYFKAVRNPRLERYATETNKLIIRLNKLLTNRPTDQQQIKQHEQNVSSNLFHINRGRVFDHVIGFSWCHGLTEN